MRPPLVSRIPLDDQEGTNYVLVAATLAETLESFTTATPVHSDDAGVDREQAER
jgi:hypothetical protein